MKFLASAVAGFGLVAILGSAFPAAAHGWHDGPWHRGPWYHGPRTTFYFRPVYREPPPVVVYRQAPPPVVVYTEPAPVTVSPASPAYTDARGRTCREYQTTVTVGGTPQPAYGTACLQPDGSWRVVR